MSVRLLQASRFIAQLLFLQLDVPLMVLIMRMVRFGIQKNVWDTAVTWESFIILIIAIINVTSMARHSKLG